MNKPKQTSAWVLIPAMLSLPVRLLDLINNFNKGWVQALGFVPLEGPQSQGFDFVVLVEWTFVIWLVWIVYRSWRFRADPPAIPPPTSTPSLPSAQSLHGDSALEKEN